MDVTSDQIAAHTGGTFGTRLLARHEYDSLLYTVGVITENKLFYFITIFIWRLFYCHFQAPDRHTLPMVHPCIPCEPGRKLHPMVSTHVESYCWDIGTSCEHAPERR